MATAPPLVDPHVLAATAYHEAGHCVLAFTCGHQIATATIARSTEHAGRVFHRDTGRRGPLDHVDPRVRRMMVAAAGQLAEQRAGYEGSFLGAMGDREVIKAPLAELADERGVSRDVIWQQVQREVRDALRDPEVWRAVEAVASALIEHGTLGEDEIKHLIRSSGEPPGPAARPGAGAPHPPRPLQS